MPSMITPTTALRKLQLLSSVQEAEFKERKNMRDMVKTPREIADFLALPLTFSSTSAFTGAKHYLYLKPHDPKLAEEDAPRSLFLVNIPTFTTELHIRHLFATQLGSGRVERVDFSEDVRPLVTGASGAVKSSKKRKRMAAEEIEAGLHAYNLPQTYNAEIRVSGAAAIVVFVDKPSMETSLKAAKKVAKQNSEIVWGEGIEERLPALGIERYEEHNRLQYPSRKDLLRRVDGYMTAYAQMEEVRAKENARKRQLPDEDGFITVGRGAKPVAKMDEVKELAEKQKDKTKGLEDFYRFQMREKRREEHGEMLRKFEQDKRRVKEMREIRGKLKVCAIICRASVSC